MKNIAISNTGTRIISGVVMALVLGGAFALQHFGVPAVRWLSLIVALGCIAEFTTAAFKNRKKLQSSKYTALQMGAFFIWLVIFAAAAWHVGARPWIMLLLLLIICASDTAAWLFGRVVGGDKMWPALSPNKTWSGQIAGVISGTLVALLYGFIGTAVAAGHFDYGQFVPQLFWIGMSVALLSQYGDLTASGIKRQLNIKDFSHVIPGHGGLLDRVDGWIYILPIVWLVTM